MILYKTAKKNKKLIKQRLMANNLLLVTDIKNLKGQIVIKKWDFALLYLGKNKVYNFVNKVVENLNMYFTDDFVISGFELLSNNYNRNNAFEKYKAECFENDFLDFEIQLKQLQNQYKEETNPTIKKQLLEKYKTEQKKLVDLKAQKNKQIIEDFKNEYKDYSLAKNINKKINVLFGLNFIKNLLGKKKQWKGTIFDFITKFKGFVIKDFQTMQQKFYRIF